MKKVSIQGTLDFNNRLLLFVTVFPALLISLFYLINIQQYQKIVHNVTAAQTIKKDATSEIPNVIWYQVSGKAKNTNEAINVIYHYQTKLKALQNASLSSEQVQTAAVATRTLETIEKFAWAIESNLANQAPVADNEKLADEIRNVTELLEETLQEYVEGEIVLATKKSEEISHTIYLMLALEILVLGSAVTMMHFNKLKTERVIRQPLNSLSSSVSEIAKGNWQTKISEPGVLELDPLADDLNKMKQQLQILFAQNSQKQKSLAVSEIKVLQAQITPHFIYNSLDAILTLAQKSDIQQVAAITYALSNYFKITLNQGNEWIQADREIEHISNYLDILKIRYGPVLEYDIKIEAALEQQMILKMILQPIVENAMYHGIKNSRGRGLITVRGFIAPPSIYFTIQDNGSGMTLAELNKTQQGFHALNPNSSNINGGYGMYNVYRRMKLYFGDDSDLTIDSLPRVGTFVTIKLPLKIEKYKERI